MSIEQENPVVSFRHVSMQFPGVLANDDITLDIRQGEIFALIGENGAGKSTLMNILYGMQTPTEGEVLIHRKKVEQFSPATAIAAGVGMVHQHFMLVPSFTVAQNIVLNDEPRKGIFYDFRQANRLTEELVQEYGLKVNPTDRVQEISLGLQQRVEILKTLHRGAEILILDEPTAVLTPQETDELFDVIRRIVREKNMTIIIITHKLYEVMAISDRVGVMRAGKLVGTCMTSEVDERILASMMVGKEVLLAPLDRRPVEDGDDAIHIDHLQVLDDRGLPAVRDLSLHVEKGEILGIAGIEGNGQSELIEAVAGLRAIRSGQVRILGQDIRKKTPAQIRQIGVAHVPEDRKATGVSVQANIADNLITGKQRQKEFAHAGFVLRSKNIRKYTQKLFKRFDIRGAGTWVSAGSLSGGNMQKVVVAREFSFDSDVLLISQPTRGVDIGAMDFIHQQIIEKRNNGCAILLVSADLDELFRLSDRMVTIYEGRITGIFDPKTATKAEISYAMTNASETEVIA